LCIQLESRRNEVLVLQKGVEEFTRDMPGLGGNELGLEEQQLWQMQKEELEKELYDVSVVPLCPWTMFPYKDFPFGLVLNFWLLLECDR
jgi:hypothetical protein